MDVRPLDRETYAGRRFTVCCRTRGRRGIRSCAGGSRMDYVPFGTPAERSFDDVAVEIDHHHVFRFQGFVLHAARLDDDPSARAVDGRDIAPREDNQTVTYQIEVRFENLFFQIFQHRLRFIRSFSRLGFVRTSRVRLSA